MLKLSAPNGQFELRTLINAGACPECGNFVESMWYFIPSNKSDEFVASTSIVMSCENCAGGTLNV